MMMNTKVRYALRTLMEIALSEKPEGVYQKDISFNQKISNKYLDSIISSLKVKGLIANAGGKRSGYLLATPVEKITLYDVYTAFEPVGIVPCINNPSICVKSEMISGTTTYDAKIDRVAFSGGWFFTKNIMAKLEYVNQNYGDQFPANDYRKNGNFKGFVLEAVVSF